MKNYGNDLFKGRLDDLPLMPGGIEKRVYTTLLPFNDFEYKGEKKLSFFDTKQEILNYCMANGISTADFIVALDYIRYFEGKTDVVRMVGEEGVIKFVASYDEDGYLEYESDQTNNSHWVYKNYNGYEDQNSSKDIYASFKQRGIVLENDVFEKVAQKFKKISQMAR